jgi:PAS domain S-box-containing protein
MNRKPRQASSPEITLLAGFGLAFALLLVTSVAQRRSIQQLIETDARVAHARQVRTELEGVYSAIQQGESGTRGYVITGQQEYLGQQQAGMDRAQQHLRSLHDLTANNPRHVRSCEKLSELAARKIAMMHYLTALRRNRGFPAAEKFTATEAPLQLMNEIRAQVDIMEAEEAALLERRQAASEAEAQRSRGAVALGTLLALGVLLASAWNVRRDWLKRRHAEEALRTERERLLGVLEALPPMICLLDRDHRVTFANRPFRDKFGEPGGRHCYEQLFGSSAPCEFCQAYSVLETGQPRRWECATPDGSLIDVCDIPFTDVDGSPMILEMDVDISETRRLAQALERTVAELREAQRVGRLGNWSIDLATGQVRWSEQLYSILDYPPSCPVPPLEEQSRFFTPESWAAINARVEKCRQEGIPYEIETETVSANGTHGWQLARGEAVLDGKGSITGLRGIAVDITERKRAEEERDEARRRVASILESISDGFFAFDRDFRHMYVNAHATKILGRSKEQMLGRNHWEVFPDARGTESEALLRRSMDQRITLEYENFYGGRWFAAKTYPADDGGLSVYFRDITDRKEAEDAVRRSEAELKEAQRVARLGSWSMDVKTGSVTWSEELYRMLGLDPSPQAPSYAEHRRLFTPESWGLLAAAVENTAQTGTPYELELEMVRPDGSTGWMLSRGEAVRDASGTITGLRGIAQDITEQKRAEAAQRESEERYRSVVAAMAEGIVIQDARGAIVACNQSAQTILGLTEDQVFGRTSIDSQWEAIHEDGSPFPGDTHPAMVTLRTGEPQSNVLMGLPKPNGSTTWISINAQPIRDPGEQAPRAVVTSFSDVTERKRAEEALRKNQQLLKETEQMGNVGGWDIDTDTGLLIWTEEVYHIHEVDPEFCPTVGSAIEFYAPASRPVIERAVERAIGHGEPFDLELEIVTAKGNPRTVHAIGKADPEHRRVYGFFQDITERKRVEQALRKLNRALQTISECDEVLVKAENEPALLEKICRILVTTGGYRLAWVGYADEDEARNVRPVARAGADDGYIDAARISWADNERGRGPTGKAIRHAAASVARRTSAQPDYDPWRAAAAQHGLQSSVALPLCLNSHPMGALTLYSSEVDAFDDEEIKLLSELAGDLSYGIRALRTRAEHERAEKALQESEADFRTLANAMPQMVWICMPDGLNVYFNDRWVKYTGLSLEQSYGRGWNTPFHPDDKQAAWDAWDHATATGETYRIESRLRAADGSYRWFLMRGVPQRDPSGTIVKWFGTCTDIDDLKRGEESLRETAEALRQANERVAAERERFNSILDIMPAYVVLLSQDYYVPFANRYFEERFGQSHGKRCFEYLFGRTEPCEICHSFEPFQTKTPGQWFWTGPDGRDYDIHDFPFTDSDGSMLILEMGIDITDRNRAERELRESQVMIKSIVDSTPDFIWSVDPERFGLLTFNRGIADHFLRRGVCLEAGMRPEDVFTEPALVERWQEIYRQALREGTINIDYHSPTAGSMEVTVNLLKRDQAVFGISVFAKDVTERKRAEEVLREQAALFEQAYDAMLVWELSGPISFWNRGAESLYGYAGEEAVGRIAHELLQTSLAGGVASFLQALERDGRWEGELEHVTRDGRLIVVETRMTLVRDARGARVIEATRDITERKRAETEIRELNATLERRVDERTAQLAAVNQELEAFSYSVAHDLRAPLRAIDGFSLALLEDFGTKLDREAQDDLGRVRAATVRMAELIDDLLHLSRISRAEVRREKVDLTALAQAIVSDLRKTSPERPLEFVSPPALEVEGDPSLLRIMLENLLGNAWTFSAQRRPARIELGTMEQNVRQVYFVRDNGVGFDMTYVRKLFAPFQRLHSAKDFPGTGIGLVTVARIVRKHGGDIWAEGETDKGATFYFTLESVDSSPLTVNCRKAWE